MTQDESIQAPRFDTLEDAQHFCAGVIDVLDITLRGLIQAGILPRRIMVETLDALINDMPGFGARPARLVAYEMLAARLAQETHKPRFTPVIIQGGKDSPNAE